jgi:hypothetical protein
VPPCSGRPYGARPARCPRSADASRGGQFQPCRPGPSRPAASCRSGRLSGRRHPCRRRLRRGLRSDLRVVAFATPDGPTAGGRRRRPGTDPRLSVKDREQRGRGKESRGSGACFSCRRQPPIAFLGPPGPRNRLDRPPPTPYNQDTAGGIGLRSHAPRAPDGPRSDGRLVGDQPARLEFVGRRKGASLVIGRRDQTPHPIASFPHNGLPRLWPNAVNGFPPNGCKWLLVSRRIQSLF